MPNYRRNFVPGGTYFFTVTLLERKRDLLVSEIGLLRESVRRVKRLYPFDIVAWVVLPDHLHCIWTLPSGDADYPLRWRLIKLLFAKGLPKAERLSAVKKIRGERGVWHRRYWEHTIRDEKDYAKHIDYIHVNPLKHRYVTQLRIGRIRPFTAMCVMACWLRIGVATWVIYQRCRIKGLILWH